MNYFHLDISVNFRIIQLELLSVRIAPLEEKEEAHVSLSLLTSSLTSDTWILFKEYFVRTLFLHLYFRDEHYPNHGMN